MKITKCEILDFSKKILLIVKCITKDTFRLKNKIHPNSFHIKKAIDWLIFAQKVNNDGGVSRCYDLFVGWLTSYPETSGYIIPTLIEYFHLNDNYNRNVLNIAKEIADWECSIQLENGGFSDLRKGPSIVPIIFDTSQVLLGLVSAYKEFKNENYYTSAVKAGDFLVKNQNKDGNWIKYSYQNMSYTYNVRTAWALLELYLISGEEKYKGAAENNLKWTLNQMTKNYWFKKVNSKPNEDPILHFLAYTINGILECGVILNRNDLIQISLNSSLKLLDSFEKHNKMYASFDSNWISYDNYSCLTGCAQISIIWLELFKIFKEKRLFLNAIKINNYLKQKQFLDNKFREIDGAIAGSDPIWGKYMRFKFPNWATKFFCDALILESQINKKPIKE